MGRSRLELQELFEQIPGVAEVYFQPPESVKLVYPCIIYNRDDMDTRFADNSPYTVTNHYQVTIIDANPDSEIPDWMSLFPMCLFDRHFTQDNLNHDIFDLYF